MLVSPVLLYLLFLCLDLGLSCLGKKFLLTYPVNKVYKFTGMVTLYTYHEQVTVRRNDRMMVPGLLGLKPEVITFLSLMRFRKVHFRLQFNASIYEEYNDLDHIVILDGDEDFGVSLMLLGQGHSVATMTIIPVEYHGTEYYPFFLSRNQVYMALVDKPSIYQSASLQITFYFNDKYTRTLHSPIDLQIYPYVCDNKETQASYQNRIVSTVVGFPVVVTGGTLRVIVGNCNVQDKRMGTSTDCTSMKHDDLLDMSLAVEFAAQEFIAFKGIRNDPDRSYIAVMGLRDSTSVKVHYYNLTHVQLTVNTGQTITVYLSEPYQFITSTRAIQVYLLFTSSCKQNEVGGPSMTSLIPTALFHNRYMWSLPYYLKITEHNYLVAIIRANKYYGFVYNGNKTATDEWPWKPVSGTQTWIVGEIEINDFPEVFTFSSSTNRAFGLYLYGVDLAISYLHFVDFLNAVTFRRRHICVETHMIVGDLVDNDCDGFPDEESSTSSDDDKDGKRGEDIRHPVPDFFNHEITKPQPTLKKLTETTETVQDVVGGDDGSDDGGNDGGDDGGADGDEERGTDDGHHTSVIPTVQSYTNVSVTEGTQLTQDDDEDGRRRDNFTQPVSTTEIWQITLNRTYENVTAQETATNVTERETVENDDTESKRKC